MAFALIWVPSGIRVPVVSLLSGVIVGVVLIGLTRLLYGWIAGPLPLVLALLCGVIAPISDYRAVRQTLTFRNTLSGDPGPARDMVREQLGGNWGLLIGDLVGGVLGIWLFVLR
jgi:hypothetical protein